MKASLIVSLVAVSLTLASIAPAANEATGVRGTPAGSGTMSNTGSGTIIGGVGSATNRFATTTGGLTNQAGNTLGGTTNRLGSGATNRLGSGVIDIKGDNDSLPPVIRGTEDSRSPSDSGTPPSNTGTSTPITGPSNSGTTTPGTSTPPTTGGTGGGM